MYELDFNKLIMISNMIRYIYIYIYIPLKKFYLEIGTPLNVCTSQV